MSTIVSSRYVVNIGFKTPPAEIMTLLHILGVKILAKYKRPQNFKPTLGKSEQKNTRIMTYFIMLLARYRYNSSL